MRMHIGRSVASTLSSLVANFPSLTNKFELLFVRLAQMWNAPERLVLQRYGIIRVLLPSQVVTHYTDMEPYGCLALLIFAKGRQ